METKTATCTYFIRDGKVLLAKQIEKVIGRKGYGGKIKPGQSIRGNAIEETAEESGGKKEFRVDPDQEGGIVFKEEDLEPIAFIDFYNGDETEVPYGTPSFKVYFFLCLKFSGEAIDTKEMIDPQYYALDDLPIDELVKGDELFVPQMLEGIPLSGHIRRTSDWSKVLENTVTECDPRSLNF